jgi:ADP-ribose pyrophosphatase YjhB (NUDIX family)
MSRAVEIIARGLCVRSGSVLLCRTRGRRNTYLPGGHVEFGESARESLRREVREELGVRGAAGRFLGVVEHTFRQGGRRKCEINLVFELKISGLQAARAPRSSEAYIEFLWADARRLVAVRIEPAPLRRLIPAWLRGSGGPVAFATTF